MGRNNETKRGPDKDIEALNLLGEAHFRDMKLTAAKQFGAEFRRTSEDALKKLKSGEPLQDEEFRNVITNLFTNAVLRDLAIEQVKEMDASLLERLKGK